MSAGHSRAWFVGSILTATVAVIALSGWLLWPTWQHHCAVRALVVAGEHNDTVAFLNAIDAIDQLGVGDSLADDLILLMQHPDAGVRKHVAIALGAFQCRPGAAVPALVAAFENPNEHESVRAAAAAAVGPFGTEAAVAVPSLEKALDIRISINRGARLALLLLEESGVELGDGPWRPQLGRLFSTRPLLIAPRRGVAAYLMKEADLIVGPQRRVIEEEAGKYY